MEKLLHAAPKKYTQLKIAIESLNFQDLTVKVTERLKMVDDLKESSTKPISIGGKLMLTKE